MMRKKNRDALLLLCTLLCLALMGCSAMKAAPAPTETLVPSPTAAPEPTPAPTPTPEPEIRILGTVYAPDAAVVSLRGLRDADAAETAKMLRRLPNVRQIGIGSEQETPLSWDSLKLLHDAAPQAVIDYAFTIFDRPFNLSCATVSPIRRSSGA